MSGSAAGEGGRSVIATGFLTTHPRRSANANTPCAKFRWLVIVLIARPARRFAPMYASMSDGASFEILVVPKYGPK
jgi:hypothetical protein